MMNIYPDGFNAGPFGSDTEPISVHGRPDGQVWVEGDDVCLFDGTPEDARKLAEALVDAAEWVEKNSSAPTETNDA